MHAVVARSTCPSQKCKEHTNLGPLLEVKMSKKCTPLWGEAHFQVKMLKTPHAQTTFGRSEIVSRGRRRGLCTLSKVSKPWGFWAVSTTTTQLQPQVQVPLQLQTTLHYTTPRTLHYTTLHSTTLHSITLHYITLHYTALDYTTLSTTATTTTTTTTTTATTATTTTLHYTNDITLRYTTLH